MMLLTLLILAAADPCAAAPQRTVPFAPEIADSGTFFRGSLSRDGRTLYYFRKVTPGEEDYRIFVTRLVNGQWSAPKRLALGGDHSELYPTLSADGNRLVFSSYRPIPSDTFRYQNAHLWYVDRHGDGWGEPVFMAAASELGHYHSGPTLLPNGDVRFRRTTPDWRTGSTMVTRWRAGAFQTAEPDREMEPWARIRPDLHVWGAQWGPGRRSVVLEVARRDPLTGAPGDTDLWIATRRGDGWNPPRPLGAGVNTPGTEHFAFLAPDQCRLIFTRDRTGLHQVSLAAAIADTGPAPERWAATEPLQSIRPLVGSYRGAFVRNGSVQLVDAVITKSRDTLRLAISTPDRPFPFRPAVVASAGGRLRFPSPYGPVTAQVDSVFGEIIGSATRDGATTLLHLKRSPPAPTPSLAREEVTFPSSGGVTLAGTIVRPVGAPIVAGLVVVAGRSCGNRGFGLRLLDTFAQYGIAGIAIDKRGVGQSTGNCPFATIQQFSDDALAALDRVRAALPANTPIGFLGNSAGGWVSVHAAGRAATPIDFLITTVGPATSVKQQQLDATNQVAKRLGMSADQTARARRYIDLMFAPGATQAQYDEMKATVEWAKTIGFADAFFEPSDIPTSVAGIDSLWVRLNDYDPATDLGTLRIPILAFFGGADEVVPPAENVAALRRITSEAGNTRVRVVVVPSGDHGLFQEEADQPLGGTTYWRFGRVSPLVVEEVLGFLRRR